MRKTVLILAATAMTIGGAALPSIGQARERLTGEQELAKLLEGRVAEKPVSCIPLSLSNDSHIIDKTAIVYSFGNVIYVNRPNNPESLDSDKILVTRITGSELCNLDIVSLHERFGFFYSGFVDLEQFVPYRKVKVAPPAHS